VALLREVVAGRAAQPCDCGLGSGHWKRAFVAQALLPVQSFAELAKQRTARSGCATAKLLVVQV